MKKQIPKLESTQKNWARQALLKNFDFGQKVNGKSIADVC